VQQVPPEVVRFGEGGLSRLIEADLRAEGHVAAIEWKCPDGGRVDVARFAPDTPVWGTRRPAAEAVPCEVIEVKLHSGMAGGIGQLLYYSRCWTPHPAMTLVVAPSYQFPARTRGWRNRARIEALCAELGIHLLVYDENDDENPSGLSRTMDSKPRTELDVEVTTSSQRSPG
jgi:hypothetical protein